MYVYVCVCTVSACPHTPYIAELRRHEEAVLLRVAGHAMYLGFEVGPCAPLHQWTSVVTKVDKRIEDSLFPPSMAARILLYDSHFVSFTACNSQLAPLSRENRQSAAKALQRTVKSPWQAVPAIFFHDAKLFGLPTEAQDICVRARAALLLAALRSGVLTAVEQRVHEFRNSDAAAFDPRRAWHQSSTFSCLAGVRRQAQRGQWSLVPN